MTLSEGLFCFFMIGAILGKKIRQSQIFEEKGKRVPATYISAGPCVVARIKTLEKDGYEALQLGFGFPEKKPPRFLREVPFMMDKEEPGMIIKAGDVFKPGDTVSVSGISKGKGFAGVVKRWHFAGGPKTHGQSDRLRAPGSIGSSTTPGRVYKGKKMAGRLGGEKVTVKNLKVISVDSEKNLLIIKGLVPGGRNNLLVIRKKTV